MRAVADLETTARSWFDRPAAELAHALLGSRLTHGPVSGRIVEVEAYAGPEDLASHAARGMTARNRAMFGPPGHLYVYLIYGLHHCINVVAGPGEKPEAVLIRAVALDRGIEVARRRRGPRAPEARLASGPGNVARAFGIDRSLDGLDLLDGPIQIEPRRADGGPTSSGPRVGVDYAGAWAARPMRLWISGDPHVSRG